MRQKKKKSTALSNGGSLSSARELLKKITRLHKCDRQNCIKTLLLQKKKKKQQKPTKTDSRIAATNKYKTEEREGGRGGEGGEAPCRLEWIDWLQMKKEKRGIHDMILSSCECVLGLSPTLFVRLDGEKSTMICRMLFSLVHNPQWPPFGIEKKKKKKKRCIKKDQHSVVLMVAAEADDYLSFVLWWQFCKL